MRRLRARRGSALILVLLMTLAVAALAIAAIFMTSSAGLLSRFYDRERLFRYAAESALEVQRTRLESDVAPAIPDTGYSMLVSGWRLKDASGADVPNVFVNVYAATSGDTSGTVLPFVTLLAQAYDANGTRHVRRMDLRRYSFSRYQYFVDSFPTGVSFGPGVLAGRVHSNGNWINAGSTNRFLDTVSVGGTITGTGRFELDSLPGAMPVPFPRDSTYAHLDNLANAAGLRITPVTSGGRGSRLEFVAFDADNDGSVEPQEGFFRVFDLEAGIDTSWLRGTPPAYAGLFSTRVYHWWEDRQIQNQCGAFYRVRGRWEFFPLAVHRSAWARPVLQDSATYPNFNNGDFTSASAINDYDDVAAKRVLSFPTARCFPAGSPYLMPTERFTNTSGQVTGTSADTVPFGVLKVSGAGYGGQDSTFTTRSRSCQFRTSDATDGRCAPGTHITLGRWRNGTNPAGISSAVRDSSEIRRLFAISPPYNAASRRVVSVTAGPIHVSGVVAGAVTLRVAGRTAIIDDLTYARAPNAPTSSCEDQFGIVATGDITVVDGIFTRTRRIAMRVNIFNSPTDTVVAHLGGASGVTVHGNLMSLTGSVGVETNPAQANASPPRVGCPLDATSSGSSGGCLYHVGGAAMRTFTPHTNGSGIGYRYYGSPDRCQQSLRRPPFFPLTNGYVRVRTLEIEASRANTPPEIRALLLRLKGKAL